jgi:hypothetical protein
MRWFILPLFLVMLSPAAADDTLQFFTDIGQDVKRGGANYLGEYPGTVSIGLHWNFHQRKRHKFYLRGSFDHLSNLERGGNLCVPKCLWIIDNRDETVLNFYQLRLGYSFTLIK